MEVSSSTKKLILRILLFLLYLLIGAAIFGAIESPEEKRRRNKLQFEELRKNFTLKFNISENDMAALLEGLREALDLGYEIRHNYTGGYPATNWDFMDAFFFAGNVVTTIGYGHLVPKSFWGKFVCIIYALFGIPLTGLTLRSVGNRISEVIQAGLKQFDRRVYNRETEKLEIKTAIIAFVFLLLIIFVPAIGFADVEEWGYFDSVYFCFITLTTIGFGDFVPRKVARDRDGKATGQGEAVTLEFLNLLYMVIGLAIMSGVIVSISSVIEEKTKNIVVDPLEALRTIRVENLNTRALKKLGYKMGTAGSRDNMGLSHDDIRSGGIHPKLAVSADRSKSSEKVEFHGPTPVLHLSREKDPDLESPSTKPKIFQNKISPDNTLVKRNNEEPSKCVSTELALELTQDTASNVEENLSTHGEDVLMKCENKTSTQENSSEVLENQKNTKNSLTVEVQVTPLPSPRSSPVPSPSSLPMNRTSESVDDNPREEAELDEVEPAEFTASEDEELSGEKKQVSQDHFTKSSKENLSTDTKSNIDEKVTDHTQIAQNGFITSTKPQNNKMKRPKKETFEMKNKPIKKVKR